MSQDGAAGAGSETARVRDIYERSAARYDRLMAPVERLLLGDGRRWVTSRVRGAVLEVALGTGRNLGLFPRDARLTGVDLSPEMLARARDRAAELGVEADLRQGDAQRLDLPDASFDTVVATLALCSIPDDVAAVREMARVLRPGGRLLLLEHAASPLPPVRAVQRALNPLSVRAQGDHQLREPDVAVRAAGLEIEELHRSGLGIVVRLEARKR